MTPTHEYSSTSGNTLWSPGVRLTTPNPVYKPFNYPWAYDAWLTQQRIHWLPEEVPLADDVKDWAKKLTAGERNLLTQIFRFFVQADIEVANCYHQHYLSVFQPTEVRMMLTAFSAMETVHIAAYSHLLDTIGMPETEYAAFLAYKEMKDKYDFMQKFRHDSTFDVALTLAGFGAFTEGLQLFASFAMLLNFPRTGKMKGMGQIITWSVRDETLHCNSIVKLFHTWVKEHEAYFDAKMLVILEERIRKICHSMVDHEDAFIDLAFGMGPVDGLTAEDVKLYIRWIANKRLNQLGYSNAFAISRNPLPWLDDMLNGAEHVNFFENRSTEYSKASTKGSWGDVWQEVDTKQTSQSNPTSS